MVILMLPAVTRLTLLRRALTLMSAVVLISVQKTPNVSTDSEDMTVSVIMAMKVTAMTAVDHHLSMRQLPSTVKQLAMTVQKMRLVRKAFAYVDQVSLEMDMIAE
jgi:hypothetical protein